jgi:hypothetical protein
VNIQYKALSYIGLAWLSEIGTFDTESEAIEALENDFEKQIELLEIPENEIESERERFWFDSRIERVQS